MATHSLEILTEAEPDDIVVINKKRERVRESADGSRGTRCIRHSCTGLNPVLTQLAKTRATVFVEGKDFQIIGRFAAKLGNSAVGNRRDFAVVPVEGFNPERIRSLRTGMEATLAVRIKGSGDFG